MIQLIKFTAKVALFLSLCVFILSCGWSSEDEEKYMLKCKSEVFAAMIIGKGAEKLLEKDLTSNLNLNSIEVCDCTYKVDESLYDSYEDYIQDRGDRRKLSSSLCQRCFYK